MPITAAIVAALAHWLVGLSWTESLLLGALLSPTDPVLVSGVVTDPRVPRVIRHSLNLESGLNDGLALPAVLAFAAALDPDDAATSSGGASCSRTSASASPSGLALRADRIAAPAPGRARAPRRVDPRPPACALRAGRRLRDLRPDACCRRMATASSAVFVAAIVLGIRRPDLREQFAGQRRGDHRDRQAGDLHRVRLAADAPRPVLGRLGRRGRRRRAVPARPGRSPSGWPWPAPA